MPATRVVEAIDVVCDGFDRSCPRCMVLVVDHLALEGLRAEEPLVPESVEVKQLKAYIRELERVLGPSPSATSRAGSPTQTRNKIEPHPAVQS